MDINSKFSLQEIIDQTVELQKFFRQFEERPWTIDAFAIEFLAEAGTLADSIMIKEGYRKTRTGHDVDIEDDISDVLFVLLMIAYHYNIDMEKAYLSMIETTRRKLENRAKSESVQETGK